MSGYGRALLLDNSVWARLLDGRLVGSSREAVEASLAEGELWLCPPSLLEISYSARDSEQFAALATELDAVPRVPLRTEAGAAAVSAQRELAAAPGVSHRVKPIDLLIAAVASTEELGVLHFDHDYDAIAQHTSLSFESVWVAPRGSVD